MKTLYLVRAQLVRIRSGKKPELIVQATSDHETKKAARDLFLDLQRQIPLMTRKPAA